MGWLRTAHQLLGRSGEVDLRISCNFIAEWFPHRFYSLYRTMEKTSDIDQKSIKNLGKIIHRRKKRGCSHFSYFSSILQCMQNYP